MAYRRELVNVNTSAARKAINGDNHHAVMRRSSGCDGLFPDRAASTGGTKDACHSPYSAPKSRSPAAVWFEQGMHLTGYMPARVGVGTQKYRCRNRNAQFLRVVNWCSQQVLPPVFQRNTQAVWFPVHRLTRQPLYIHFAGRPLIWTCARHSFHGAGP